MAPSTFDEYWSRAQRHTRIVMLDTIALELRSSLYLKKVKTIGFYRDDGTAVLETSDSADTDNEDYSDAAKLLMHMVWMHHRNVALKVLADLDEQEDIRYHDAVAGN